MSTIWNNDSDYPMGTDRVPARRVVLRGRYRGKPKKDAPVANVATPEAAPVEVRVLKIPLLQSDEERGQGDSINAKFHRLIRGER